MTHFLHIRVILEKRLQIMIKGLIIFVENWICRCEFLVFNPYSVGVYYFCTVEWYCLCKYPDIKLYGHHEMVAEDSILPASKTLALHSGYLSTIWQFFDPIVNMILHIQYVQYYFKIHVCLSIHNSIHDSVPVFKKLLDIICLKGKVFLSLQHYPLLLPWRG